MNNSIFFAITLFAISNTLQAQCPKLVWSDEFEGTTLDETKWSHQTGDGCDLGENLCGWGNNELQSYSRNNLAIQDGKAIITAKRETVGTSNYTSSRIRSFRKGEITYGRVEARIKSPIGQGLWSAFWMLSTDEVYGGWPQSGEIDIMEYLGHEEDKVHGAIHFGEVWPNNSSSIKTFKVSEGSFHDDFHVFAIEWSSSKISWFVDGYLYSTKTSSDLGGVRWPFNQDFHVLLNLAVGGNFPGNPDGSTTFPQQMEIDYVRIYDMVDQAYLSGPQVVPYEAQNTIYRLTKVPENSTINWVIPETAELVSDNGSTLQLNWGQSGGVVKVVITNDCGTVEHEVAVEVEGPVASEAVLENFDLAAKAVQGFITGDFTDNVENPAPDDINDSELCGRYVRSSGEVFDVMFYTTSEVKNAADFITGKKQFYMDVYTDAPVGTAIILQLENSSRAQSDNYPTGRHSRYEVKTTKQNEWERHIFPLLDRPDGGVSHQSIDQMVLLFSPNSNNGSTYYFDNFEIFSATSTSTFEVEYDMEIIPNPVVDNLFLSFENQFTIDSVEILDTVGKRVQSERNINYSNYKMDVTGIHQGLYYIKVRLKNGDQVLRSFIKN